MGDLVIKAHDFELAKKGLQEFSQKKEQELEIDTVKTSGGFLGLGSHKVTGYELNERLSVIQNHLIDLNATNNRTIKEFGQVYKALEALDKEYIQAILISIKATEKTSEGIKVAHEKISHIIDDQKKALEILKKFKQKLDGYAHLSDIDKIWNDCQKWHEEGSKMVASVVAVTEQSNENNDAIKKLAYDQETATSKICEISNSLNEQIYRIESIISFMDRLNTIVHLSDVDEMWDSLIDTQTNLQKFCAEITEVQSEIVKSTENILQIEKFVDHLSRQEHLNDIDAIWNKAQKHASQLSALQEQNENLNNIINDNKEVSDKAVAELHKSDERLENSIQSNKATVDQIVIELHNKDDAQDELLHTYKSVTDQAICALEEKNSELSNLVQSNKETVEQDIADLQAQDATTIKIIEDNKLLAEQALTKANDQTSVMLQQMNKKILYSYLIAGGSFALAVAELILILLR